MVAEDSLQVRIGRLGRPHGIRGQLTVILHTDEPDRRFAAGVRLADANSNRSWTVAESHFHQGRLLLSLDGVQSRSAAEELRGIELIASVPVAEPASGPEEYWDRQLIGLRVLNHAGEPVGTVTAVVHPPAQDLLEVDLDAGGQALVPFVAELVPAVDLTAQTLTVADVDGLLDDWHGST